MPEKIDSADMALVFPSANPIIIALTVFSMLLLVITAAAAIWAESYLMAILVIAALLIIGLNAYLTAANKKSFRTVKSAKSITWENSLSETQRKSLDIEVAELSNILGIDDEQQNDLRTAYIIAEDLAMRQIQHEEQVPLMRKISILGIPFDVVFIKGDTVVCGDATFLLTPDIRQEKVDAMMNKAAEVASELKNIGIEMKVRLMMVLITQLMPSDDEKLKNNLNRSRFTSTQVDIDIRTLDFEELQKLFASGN